jgi:hypothetical protein
MRKDCPSTKAYNTNKYGYKYVRCTSCGGIGHEEEDHDWAKETLNMQ